MERRAVSFHTSSAAWKRRKAKTETPMGISTRTIMRAVASRSANAS